MAGTIATKMVSATPTLCGLPTELQVEIIKNMLPLSKNGILNIDRETLQDYDALADLASINGEFRDVVKDTIAHHASYSHIRMTVDGEGDPFSDTLPCLWFEYRRIESISVDIEYHAVSENPSHARHVLSRFAQLLTSRAVKSEGVKLLSVVIDLPYNIFGEEKQAWLHALEPLLSLPTFAFAAVNTYRVDDMDLEDDDWSDVFPGNLDDWLRTDVEERDRESCFGALYEEGSGFGGAGEGGTFQFMISNEDLERLCREMNV